MTLKKILRILLVISGFIPFLSLLGTPPDLMLLGYSLFVFALLLRPKIVPVVQRVQLHPYLKFVLLVIASGLIGECFAWATNYLARSKNPQLIHPQLIPNLMLAALLYSGWALSFVLLFRRYSFSLAQVFVTIGILGIFFEAKGQVLISAIQAGLLGALLIVYIFVVYGSVLGVAYMMVDKELQNERQGDSWLKYPAAWSLLFLSVLLVFVISAIFIKLVLIPKPRPIWEHPLW